MITRSPSIVFLAVATTLVALVGLLFLILFFALGGDNPFGTLNDICGALTGVLTGALVWALHTAQPENPRANRRALVTGLTGAALAVVGSGLIILDITGWVLAGLVSIFGLALVGLWLLAYHSAALHWPGFPRQLARLGITAGSIMCLGILTGFGILTRTDSLETAAWYVSIGLFLGGLGSSVLYPIWLISLTRFLLAKPEAAPPEQAA